MEIAIHNPATGQLNVVDLESLYDAYQRQIKKYPDFQNDTEKHGKFLINYLKK